MFALLWCYSWDYLGSVVFETPQFFAIARNTGALAVGARK
jgi:hypothetical protein